MTRSEPLRIVLLALAAAVGYGVAHDQITVRLCVEYFTVGHDPDLVPFADPTLLALGWGVLSTWWGGLGLGVALAVAARAGGRPKRSAASLLRPVAWQLGMMAAFAFAAGLAGFLVATQKGIALPAELAERVPRGQHPAFVACLFAHTASYWVGFVGGGIQIAGVWLTRRVPRPLQGIGRASGGHIPTKRP